MALSTADSNKWALLIGTHLEWQTPEDRTTSDYQLLGPIRQRQRRLTEAQTIEIAARYEARATVYEIAAEFGCNRTTVAARLKKAGIAMRGQPPTSEAIDSMARLDSRSWKSAGNLGSARTRCGIACGDANSRSAIRMGETVKRLGHRGLPTL